MTLKKLREARELSPTELATQARVSRAYVFRLGAGGSDPAVDLLRLLPLASACR
jgi:predicted transcriptional regulator